MGATCITDMLTVVCMVHNERINVGNRTILLQCNKINSSFPARIQIFNLAEKAR